VTAASKDGSWSLQVAGILGTAIQCLNPYGGFSSQMEQMVKSSNPNIRQKQEAYLPVTRDLLSLISLSVVSPEGGIPF